MKLPEALAVWSGRTERKEILWLTFLTEWIFVNEAGYRAFDFRWILADRWEVRAEPENALESIDIDMTVTNPTQYDAASRHARLQAAAFEVLRKTRDFQTDQLRVYTIATWPCTEMGAVHEIDLVRSAKRFWHTDPIPELLPVFKPVERMHQLSVWQLLVADDEL